MDVSDALPVSLECSPAPISRSDVESKPITRPVIDDMRISTLVSSYHHHFAKYSETHSNATQLVPSTVWKEVVLISILVYAFVINKRFRFMANTNNCIQNVILKSQA
jgi:hypothetical protein